MNGRGPLGPARLALLRHDVPVAGTLRCSGPLAAARSLASVYGVAPRDVLAALPASARLANAEGDDAFSAITMTLAEVLTRPMSTPESVTYYHGTRTSLPRRILTEGLLPRSAVVDMLWDEIAVLAPELSTAEVAALRAAQLEGEGGDRLRGARRNGPYGHIVRDVIVRPALYDAHDCVEAPETVRNICHLIWKQFGVDVGARRHATTIPCLVEFARPAVDAVPTVAAACWYVEACLRSDTTAHASLVYDAFGELVPPSAIRSVRALDGSEREWSRESLRLEV
jgi:hypothetical protein